MLGRHLDGPEGRLGVADEPRVRGVRGHADRPGVRHAHGDAVDGDDERGMKSLDDLGDGRDDALPLVVRLGSVQQVVGLTVAVREPVERERRGLVAGQRLVSKTIAGRRPR